MKTLFVFASIAACCVAASAQAPKLAIDHDDKGTVYIAPNVLPTEDAAHVKGATMGVQRPDGSGAYIGSDTSFPKPVYSLGASTGGNLSLTGGVTSDGKANNGVKAGINYKY